MELKIGDLTNVHFSNKTLYRLTLEGIVGDETCIDFLRFIDLKGKKYFVKNYDYIEILTREEKTGPIGEIG